MNLPGESKRRSKLQKNNRKWTVLTISVKSEWIVVLFSGRKRWIVETKRITTNFCTSITFCAEMAIFLVKMIISLQLDDSKMPNLTKWKPKIKQRRNILHYLWVDFGYLWIGMMKLMIRLPIPPTCDFIDGMALSSIWMRVLSGLEWLGLEQHVELIATEDLNQPTNRLGRAIYVMSCAWPIWALRISDHTKFAIIGTE